MGFEQDVLTRGHRGPRQRRRGRRPGPGPAGRGREHADRRAALAVRGRRELPGPQGQPERHAAPGGADHDGEPDLASRRQHYNATVLDYNNAHPDVPERAHRRAAGFTKREFFDAEPEAEARPDVDLTLAEARVASAAGPPPGIADGHRTFYGQIGGEQAELGPARPRRRRCSSACSGSLIGVGADRRSRGPPLPSMAIAVGVGPRRVARRPTTRATRSSSRRRARSEVDGRGDAAAVNVVRELAVAAERADAPGLPHRRHRPQRLRDGPRSRARVGRDHHRPAPEAGPRGAPGRHGPRAQSTSATSTSGSR